MISKKIEEYRKILEEQKKHFLQELEEESPIIAKLFSQNTDIEIEEAQDKYQIIKIDGVPFIIISDDDAFRKMKSILEKKYKPRKTYRKRRTEHINYLT